MKDFCTDRMRVISNKFASVDIVRKMARDRQASRLSYQVNVELDKCMNAVRRHMADFIDMAVKEELK